MRRLAAADRAAFSSQPGAVPAALLTARTLPESQCGHHLEAGGRVGVGAALSGNGARMQGENPGVLGVRPTQPIGVGNELFRWHRAERRHGGESLFGTPAAWAAALLCTGLLQGCAPGPSETREPSAPASLATATSSASGVTPPNVVLILADDLGYSDIGAYGGEIRTPHLDRLAAEGLRFSQFYNTGRCCPTRASLLTGRYPHQAGVGRMVSAAGSEITPGAYQGFLASEVPTIAESLRDVGYATYMSGKWHVGERAEHWPRQRGFDRYFGLISGASSYFEILRGNNPMQRQMVLDDELWEPPRDGFYMTDAFTEHALDMLDLHQSQRSGEPFFLYLAYTAPHWPLHAPAEDIARYAGRYDAGWESLREERWQRLLEVGLFPPEMPQAPRPEQVPAWDDVVEKARWSRLMEVYAAMVDRMDQGIGRIVERLEQNGELDNTVLVFLSDNGACAESIEARGLHQEGAEIGARGSYVAYREPWAWASNTPLRLYKQWQHEGGIRTPLIVHWPKGLSRPGELETRVGHVIDVGATLADLAGASRAGLEGESLVPLLQEASSAQRSGLLFWEHMGHRAVRRGRHKLAWDRQVARWELYDVVVDPAETRDLAAERPELLAELAAAWEQWAQSVGVVKL